MRRNAIYLVVAGLVLVAGLLAAILPGSATGHDGGASISCTAVTFAYSSFADATNQVQETVTIDGATAHAGPFTFVGPSGTHTVPISVPTDGAAHVVVAGASWDTNGHKGSFSDQQTLTCGTPPPPAERCPPGEGPYDGKDGMPGNEECCPDADGDQKCDTTPPSTPPATTTPTVPPITTTPIPPTPAPTIPTVTTPTDSQATTPEPTAEPQPDPSPNPEDKPGKAREQRPTGAEETPATLPFTP